MVDAKRLVQVLALGGVLLLAAHTAEADPPAHAVPEGLPVQLDGIVNAAEWQQALSLSLGESGAKLYLQQHRGMLLVALESPHAWPLRGNLTLFFSPDGKASGMRARDFVRINYEPHDHSRPHLIVRRMTAEGSQRVHDAVVARRWFSEHVAHVEMAFSLSVLGLTKDDRAPRRFAVHWVRPHSRRNVIWPAGLDFIGKPQQMPPDLATAGRWCLLNELGDPTGPGAFPKTVWTKFIEHDRELTRRGQEAHAAVNLLREEWKKTKKRNDEFEKEVFENLEWVQKHEKLSAGDLLARATTLRYLNRRAEALGILDALVNRTDRAASQSALFERVLTLESVDRYVEAARDWSELARRVPQYAGIYKPKAAAALDKAQAHAKEQRADAEDPNRATRPLVALHTPRGLVVLELFADEVPHAAEHFLNLVEAKFYDGLFFHRVKGDFLAQVGCPKTRQGCEFGGRGTSPIEVEMERNERREFWRGTVGFARRDRKVNGSQFFILTSPRLEFSDPGPEDEDGYTLFGRVVSGMGAVDEVAYCDRLDKAVVLRR